MSILNNDGLFDEIQRIAPDQPGKLTDEELGVIAAKALKGIDQTQPCEYRLAKMVAAVREAVEKQQGEEIARLTADCKGLLMSLDDTSVRMVKAEKTAESKHGCWMQELAKVSALEKQLLEALPWRESCEKWQASSTKNAAQLATVTAERDRLQWRPVSVKPTAKDADEEGYIAVTNGKDCDAWSFDNWANILPRYTHWIAFSPPPAPSAEDAEREKFEKAYRIESLREQPEGAVFDNGVLARAENGDYLHWATRSTFRMWQAARAVKEEEE